MSYLNTKNKISILNSTTATLAAGASFSGTWEDASAYNSVVVAVSTDQNGTYQIQYSPDGINLDTSLIRYYRTNQIEPPHRFTITRKFFRVNFINTSSSPQTYLRLQTMFGDKTELNAPSDSIIPQDFDSLSVRPTKFEYEVALSRRQGYTTWNKWGYNSDIDTGTETIWSVGGIFRGLTSSSNLSITSTSANDTASGSGAQSIVITGVGSDRLSQTEVITLNGTAGVTTSNSWLGINRAAVYLAGTFSYNVGDINMVTATSSIQQAQIPVGQGSTQQAFFFTQTSHQGLMDWMLINVVKIGGGGGDPVVTVKGWVTSLVSGARYEVFRHIIDTAVENTVELRPSQPFVVGEKSLITFEATTDKDNTAVSIRFSLIEVKDFDA